MQNYPHNNNTVNFSTPQLTSSMWRKRTHADRSDGYDSDSSSVTSSPWRAMKRLRVEELENTHATSVPPPALPIRRMISEEASSNNNIDPSGNVDYANFNQMLGALHLQRQNRPKPNSQTTHNLQFHQQSMPNHGASPGFVQNAGGSSVIQYRSQKKQIKLKTSSKLG